MTRPLLPRASWLWVLGLLGAGPALAQSNTQTLLSYPPRAELHLDGPVKVTGTSPLLIEEPLRGYYLLTATKPGFATQRARIYFPEGGGSARPAGGSTVSGVGGVVRTLLLPGAAQWASGERGHGLMLLASEAWALGWVIKSESDYRAGLSALEQAGARQAASGGTILDPEAQAQLQVDVQQAQDRVDDARAARKRWFLVAGAAWGYSVLDQLVLRGSLDVQPAGLDTLHIRMRYVSRSEAVLRSAVIPGSGQAYAGHHGRGGWFTLLGTAALSLALSGEQHLDRTLSEQAEAQVRYDALGAAGASQDRLNQARDDLERRYAEASNARRTRNLMWTTAALVWGLNVLDAALMDIPGEGGRLASAEPRQGLYAQFDPGSMRLGFRRGF